MAALNGEWARVRDRFAVVLDRAKPGGSLEELGWAGWWLADERLTLNARERAYRHYRAARDAAGAGRVATWLAADLREFRGDDALARGWLQRAHRFLDPEPESVDHGWLALIDADFALHLDHDRRRAVAHARRGARLGRRLAVADQEAVGLGLEGLALVGLGDVGEGLRRLDEAAAIVATEPLQLPLSAGWALCCGLSACDAIGDFPRARRWCDAVQGLDAGRQLLGICRTTYGRVLAAGGDWAGAERELSAAIRDLQSARPGMAGTAFARLGELRARQGRADEARELFERAGPHGHVGLGELALAGGDARTAIQAAERALRRVPPDAVIERVPALELLARALLRDGDVAAAEAPCAAVTAAAEAAGTLYLRGRARLLAGELAAARRDTDAARRAAEDALDCFGECAAPYDAALARVALGRVLRGAAAERELAAAREAFAALGAPGELKAAGACGELTARELEVLRLVAQGLSDTVIAERLVLSPHTVHRHVANVRAKLRLPSRAAAVAYATRAGLL